MPPSPLRFSHTPDPDVPIYDLTAAKVGEVCPIIGKEELMPIDLIPMSGEMRLYRYGHLLSTQARMLKERDDYGQEVETPRTARSTCSIFVPPDHSYYTRVSKIDGGREGDAKDTNQTQTPITAHSTCSVFFPPATPGTGTKTGAGVVDMGLKHSNDRPVKVKFFGYQREYPYTLDFQKMKNLNGYEKGMCSAPLYPSTLEKEASRSQYFPESCCTTPATGYGKERFDTTAAVDGAEPNDKEHSDISSDSEEGDRSSSEGRSSTAPSVADSSNPTTPTSSTGSIPHIVVTPPQQAKQTALESPADLSPAPKRKAKKPIAACGGYAVYKNSLPLRNWQASDSDSDSASSSPSDEQTSDSSKEDDTDISTTTTATTTATAGTPNNENEKIKGKSNAKDDYHYVNYCNENWSQSKKDEFSRSLAMFYAQGRAQAATRKAMAWCEQQRSHNSIKTSTNTSDQRQPSRREAGKKMISLIARRVRGSETATIPK